MHLIVEQNKDIFETCYKSAGESLYNVSLGFGLYSPKMAFNAVLNDDDDFHLPLCLLFIYFGTGGLQARKTFALDSLRNISLDISGRIKDNVAAYLFAYCLNRDGQVEYSQQILDMLVYDKFPPAFITQGDLKFIQGDNGEQKSPIKKPLNSSIFMQKGIILGFYMGV